MQADQDSGYNMNSQNAEDSSGPFGNIKNVSFHRIPTKSDSDSKEYLSLQLPNGLRMLLISDVKNVLSSEELDKLGSSEDSSVNACDETESSESGESDASDCDDLSEISDTENKSKENSERLAACALTVGAGSFSDPEEIPGLAHFLEHMVFMGSKKYPKENEYDSYINSRGGSDNASTECEYTSFYFECPEIHLDGALDRFTSMFVSPLMNRDSISREREAVESEFKLQLSSDSTRMEQLLCSTAPANNPSHKFTWGNLITLQQNVEDDALYEALHKFRERYYSAHRMTVAIQARLPMDILLNLVTKYFTNIPNNSLPPDVFPYVEPPFDMELFHKMYTVQPVKDINKLFLTWALPSVIGLYKSKPLSYISFLIGHEGEGSLLAYLQEKLWALHILAINGDDGIETNSMYSLFSIEIGLTEDGLSNIEHVLHLVFSYIKLLQNTGPIEYIFREIQLVDDNNFRFADEDHADDYVEHLSQNMQIYPPEHYINGDRVISDYEPEQITRMLGYLSPDKVNIMIASKIAAANVELDKAERWFSTKYNQKDIQESWLVQWRDCEPDTNFHLPKPNMYIANDYKLLPLPTTTSEYPERILKEDHFETWHKQDTKFLLPIAYLKIYMISPIAGILPQNKVMCDFIVFLFYLISAKDIYPATVAGLGFKFTVGDNGLNLSVEGYNQKLPLLLETMLTIMKTLGDNISENLFDTIKEELRKKYYNKMLKASSLATELRLSILTKPFWPTVVKLDTLSHINLDKLRAFSQHFFENLYIKCLIQGNVNVEQAVSISNQIKSIISHAPILEGSNPLIQVRKLSMGDKVLRVQSFNEGDPNCNITNYYQCGMSDIESSCIVELIMMIMHEPLFDTLRTQEQLGYDVNCQVRITNGILGFTVTVNSQVDKFSVEHVEGRITTFLNTLMNDLNKMKPTEFNQIKESLRIVKLQSDDDLKTEVDRNWSEITSNEYIFDRLKREVKCIESLKQKQTSSFFRQLLQTDKRKSKLKSKDKVICLRKLSVQVDSETKSTTEHGHSLNNVSTNNSKGKYKLQIKTPSNEAIQPKFIKEIEAYKNSLYIFPNVKRNKNK